MKATDKKSFVSFSGLFTLSFSALLALGLFFGSPVQALAKDVELPVGKAAGEHGLTVTWEGKMEVPGKTREDDYPAFWIVVKPAVNGQALDEIVLDGSDNAPSDYEMAQIADYNFDGYDDMWVCEDWGLRGPVGSTYLFNPGTGKLELNESFSEFNIFDVDKDKKTLTTLIHGSAIDNAEQVYIVKGFDELELVSEEGTEGREDLMEKNQYVEFKRTYKDGKLVTNEEKIVDMEE